MAATVLIVAAISLTGCSGSPGDAAIVEGVRLPEATVETAHQAYVQAASLKPDEARLSVVTVLIQDQIARQLGARDGIATDQASLDKAIAGMQLTSLLAAGPEGKEARDGGGGPRPDRGQQARRQVPGRGRQARHRTEPRYGTWDKAKVAVSGTSGSLSAAAPASNG